MIGKKFNLELFLISVLVPQAVGALSVFFAGNVTLKYGLLEKPFWAPPSIIFPIAWGILYLLMGIAFYIVKKSEAENKSKAVFYYTVQLGANFLWTIFFFGIKMRFFSFVWIIIIILLVLKTIKEFYCIDKKSAILLFPYLLWLIYACFLNFEIWRLNR